MITDGVGAAKRLGVSQQRLRQLDDVLRPVRFARCRVYSVDALDRYVAARDASKAGGR